MPSIYGATLHALTMTRDRLRLIHGGGWEPERMVDYGSGTASAAWAFDAVWGGGKEEKEYVGLDASRSMVELGSSMVGALPKRMVEGGGASRLDARVHQLVLPASTSSLARLHLAPKSDERKNKRTIAIAAFSLGDLGTKEKRKELIRSMWESGAELLVVVERGTPGGSRMVVEAREQLLMFGRRNAQWAEDLESVEGAGGPAKGCFVLAPVCPSASLRLRGSPLTLLSCI
jgi:ribosomal protein RSM22 (predicted rRNA methylase)